MKKKYFHLLVPVFISIMIGPLKAQQNVGIGTTTPNASAQLDVSSTNKGALIPRMTTTQRKAISAPAAGLLVFDMDKKTIYMFDGSKWHPFLFSTNETKLPPYPMEASDGVNNDYFGFSVSISGDYAIVGAPYDSENAVFQGSAYIFFRNGGVWTQQAKLFSPNYSIDDHFGYSVGISGDYAVVGAPDENVGPSAQGRAYVFHRSGSTWTAQGSFTSSDGGPGDRFGYSVVISGDYVIVGAPNFGAEDKGGAYIFYREFTWIFGQGFTAKLAASDGLASDQFGWSVCIDGDYAIIGTPYDDGTAIDQGSVYIYYRGAGWLTTGLPHQAKLVADAASDRFGYSVSINGDYVIVGASNDDNSTITDQGSAYIYFRTGVTWNFQTKLVAFDGSANDVFGRSVCIKGEYAIIGAVGDDVGLNSDQGSCYLYKRTGTTWSLVRKIDDDNGKSSGLFGYSVSVSGYNLLIGAYQKNNFKGEINFLNIE